MQLPVGDYVVTIDKFFLVPFQNSLTMLAMSIEADFIPFWKEFGTHFARFLQKVEENKGLHFFWQAYSYTQTKIDLKGFKIRPNPFFKRRQITKNAYKFFQT